MSNLNSFLDNALETAKVVANAAGKKTEEVVETSKLRLQAMSISNELKQVYEKIGTMVYYAQKDNMDVQAAVQAQIAKVDQLLDQLRDTELRAAELKKIKKCSNCGASCPSDSHFCSRCGMVVNEPTVYEVVITQEPEDMAPSEEEAATEETVVPNEPAASINPEEAEEPQAPVEDNGCQE